VWGDKMKTSTTTQTPPNHPPVNDNPGGVFTLDVPVIVCVLLLWRELVSLKTQLKQQINGLCKVVSKLEEVAEKILRCHDPFS
jgi:hypothetical protein